MHLHSGFSFQYHHKHGMFTNWTSPLVWQQFIHWPWTGGKDLSADLIVWCCCVHNKLHTKSLATSDHLWLGKLEEKPTPTNQNRLDGKELSAHLATAGINWQGLSCEFTVNNSLYCEYFSDHLLAAFPMYCGISNNAEGKFFFTWGDMRLFFF